MLHPRYTSLVTAISSLGLSSVVALLWVMSFATASPVDLTVSFPLAERAPVSHDFRSFVSGDRVSNHGIDPFG